jgi:hypothetical protein
MSLLFRKSKYSFNSYKFLNPDKNVLRVFRFYKFPYTWVLVAGMVAFIIQINMVKHLMRRLINENKWVRQNFEDRKMKQMAFDYMIYSGSTKEGTDAEKFSLF